ncbi:hypothetical protein PINS_up017145, partial [Pythium insidiosum]
RSTRTSHPPPDPTAFDDSGLGSSVQAAVRQRAPAPVTTFQASGAGSSRGDLPRSARRPIDFQSDDEGGGEVDADDADYHDDDADVLAPATGRGSAAPPPVVIDVDADE